MASGTRPVSPRFPFASPDERGRVAIPATGGGLQPLDDLLRAGRALAGQSPTDDDALDRFRHVQPTPGDRRVERHHPVLHQPADKGWCLLALQIKSFQALGGWRSRRPQGE